jgi:sugar lactone lactonase YvrE
VPFTPVDVVTALHSGLVVDSPADSGQTGATGHTAAPIDPCTLVPWDVLSFRPVSNAPPSEEFSFDAAGDVFTATEGTGVFRTSFAGDRELVSPGYSWEYAGVRVSPDGAHLTLCDEAGGVVLLVDLATGSQEDLVSIAGPNSIGWDDWGRLWIGANQRLALFDPAVGGAPVIVADRPGADLDGITFAPDGRAVYFNDDSGHVVGRVELDAAGGVVAVSEYADLGGGYFAAELDGMTTDTCGNLYVTHTDGKLTRIWADGTIQTLVPTSGHWTTSVNFGSGVGGWERDRLYVMDRSEGLWELDVGVLGHPEPHLP